MQVNTQAPWLFRMGKSMIRRKLRGGHRLIGIAAELGWLNTVVRYKLNEHVGLTVPLYRPDNQFDLRDILEYEAALIANIGERVKSLSGDVVLCDCGADIGLFSASLLALRCGITRIIAFEPNTEAHEMLVQNCRSFPCPAVAYHAAVWRQTGKGRLALPEYDHSAHAAFIFPCDDGDVTLMRVDDVGISAGANLVLKIDVEGSEMGVIDSAAETLGRVTNFVVAMEANRDAVERSGVDTSAILQRLYSIRPCAFEVAEEPNRPLNLDRPFFEQFTALRVYNIVAYTYTA
jgi:FkbM family methyltransferase